MSITSYTGFPGSGKSYEVVKNVLLPSFCAGRRIVTNIDGVSFEKFEQYVLRNNPQACIGQIVNCTSDDILAPGFYPTNQDDISSFVRPGDLVIIDEAQNFYSKDRKLHESEKIFFREHRHFCDEFGRGSDVVLIHQAINDIVPFLKDTVEASFRMVQNKVFGSKKTYRVFVYHGAQKLKINMLKRYYENWVFDLYKSFSVSGGFQADVDKRQSIFNRRFFIGLAVIFGLFLLSMKSLFGTFSVDKYQTKETDKKSYHETRGTLPSGASKPVVSSAAVVLPSEIYSARWRILGIYSVGTARYVVLYDRDNVFRFEHPQKFKENGSRMWGLIDGAKVTYFTGDFTEKNDKKGFGL